MFKLKEDTYIKEIEDYIKSTYSQHYTNEESGKQVIESIIAKGRGLDFCLGNIEKYESRFGKKNGYNRKDLMKLIHYGILALVAFDRNKDKQHELLKESSK